MIDRNPAAPGGQDPIGAFDPHAKSPDPFADLEGLRLSQDFGAGLGVKKVLTTVPVKRPGRQDFVRVRSGEEWRIATGILTDSTDRSAYMIERSLWSGLDGDVRPTMLFTTISKQGDLSLWPIPLPSPDGRMSTWHESALAAAKLAEVKWVKVIPNMRAGVYDTYEAAAALGEPTWPELSFREILKLAFGGRYITAPDHPVLKRLRGEL